MKNQQYKMYKGMKWYVSALLMFFLISGSAVAQHTVKGKVYSMAHEKALEGIEVKLANMSSEPVYTSGEGAFEMEVPSENVYLEFSYAGYKSTVKYANVSENVIVYMVLNTNVSVEDIIPVPYGELKDKHFTGSKSHVGHDELQVNLFPTIDSRLRGLASGVRVINNSGTPGSGSTLLIRGISTLNGGTQPLFVVDGLVLRNYPYENPLSNGANHNPLSDLNPNDIRSVTVIKDGAQSAFYGVRGGNGVVLIETNMGSTGKTTLSLDAYTGVSMMPKQISMLNATDYKSYFKELNYANGLSPFEFGLTYGKAFYEDPASADYYRYNGDNNWQDIVTEPGVVQNYYLNLKGGDQVTTYAFSTGYLNQDGMVKGTNFQRFTIDFNLIYRISEKMRFGNVVNFTYSDKSLMDEGINVHSNPLFISLAKAPQFSPYALSATGEQSVEHEDQDFFEMSNPSHVITNLENTVGVNRLMGSVYLDFDVAKDLIGRIDLGIDYNRQAEKRFYPDFGLSTAENADRFSESKVNNRFLLQTDAYLKYDKYFNNVHHVKGLIGAGVYSQSINYTYGKGINSAADYFTTLKEAIADSLSSGLITTRMISSYARVNYAYKDKIILEANARMDGSSRFGKNNRYGYFPGISGAWRLSEEEFLKDNDFVNELKLKTGFGVTGNENIEDYAAYNTFYGGAYNERGAILPYNLGNTDLKWETSKQFDFGVQFYGHKNRLGAEVDFYVKSTSDLFYFKELPAITGYAGMLDNLGNVNNTGVDVNLFYRVIDKEMVWDARLIMSSYKNEVTKLPGGEFSTSSNGFIGLAREEEPIGVFYGYNAVGLFDSEEEAAAYQNSPGYESFQAGDVKYEDMNDDFIIDEQDMDIIGDPHPDLYGSFLNSFRYKGWKLNINVGYSLGNEAINTTRRELESMSGYYNQSTSILQAWRKTGDAAGTDMPRISLGDPTGNTRNSSRWVEDASYLRLQLASLSYDLPESLAQKLSMNSATIYLKGQNLYTLSKYLGYAPDFISGYNPLLYGIDTGTYPMPRTILIGITLGL